MKAIAIQSAERDSIILIGERFQNLKKYIPAENVFLITDQNVAEHYRNDFPDAVVLTIGSGEMVKTLDTVRGLYQQLVKFEADRSSFIVGFGGGVVCDIVGFVASTFLRGVRFGFVASTLLAQVDAGVGGKNGVNLDGFKNLVGVFNHPEFVICDLNLLKTLPKREILCGLAEIVKHAAIADADLFGYLEKHVTAAAQLDDEVIKKLVFDSVVIKSDIVNKDQKEKSERRKLNFGHTFGHALEKHCDVSHGEAVSAGMAAAAALSRKKGYLSAADERRIKQLLQNLKLPTRIEIGTEDLLDAVAKDKKRSGQSIKFVFLNRIGNAMVEEISFAEMRHLATYLFDIWGLSNIKG